MEHNIRVQEHEGEVVATIDIDGVEHEGIGATLPEALMDLAEEVESA